jgi:cell wall-associated NlpC family hydrolase
MTRAEIIAETRRWIGTRYVKRGRTEYGLDCLGLLVMVGRHFEIPHTDEQHYSDWPRGDLLILTRLSQYLRKLPPSTPLLAGMVGVFAERRLPGHAGIFSELHGQTHLIHARIHPGKVIEECWGQVPNREFRLIGLFDFPGVE